MEASDAISYKHSFDLVFKLVAKVFTGKTLSILGVKGGKIVEVRGLEPVTLQAKEERVDMLLKDDLTSVLVISGEVTPKKIIETNSGRYVPMIVNLNDRDVDWSSIVNPKEF